MPAGWPWYRSDGSRRAAGRDSTGACRAGRGSPAAAYLAADSGATARHSALATCSAGAVPWLSGMSTRATGSEYQRASTKAVPYSGPAVRSVTG